MRSLVITRARQRARQNERALGALGWLPKRERESEGRGRSHDRGIIVMLKQWSNLYVRARRARKSVPRRTSAACAAMRACTVARKICPWFATGESIVRALHRTRTSAVLDRGRR